jgi:succinyl-diaminopimelate desuccinylase
MSADPVGITRDLLRCRSVTPAEGGALKFLETVLKAAGFTVHRITFREPGADDVENLYARIGDAAPNLVFAGHTDVVPPGDEKAWKHPPFAGEVGNGHLYGRGAVDMKGGIACAVAAVLDHLATNGGKPQKSGGGSISFLITGDEEGIAVNGTPKLLTWAAERGEKFDHCILGEPSNQEELGDTIKIGRRGSLNGHLIVTGQQGHVAYPQRADNPIRGLVALIAALQSEPLDAGNAQFSASHLEFTSVDVGNKTVNLIPGEARARFNIRFNDRHTLESLKALIEQRAAKAAGDKIKFAFQWEPSNAGVFVTQAGPFTELVANAVAGVTGRKPELSTTGGTSDARFITAYCPVVEFGLVGQTMHQVDERVPIADLRALTTIYRKIVDKYFA